MMAKYAPFLLYFRYYIMVNRNDRNQTKEDTIDRNLL